MEYALVIHRAEEGGYWAEFPALPGCYTQGETIDEVIKRAPEAVESHVQALREDGQEVPSENLLVMTVRLPEPSAA
jgi:predicted RNase H-like HicB family nuclease